LIVDDEPNITRVMKRILEYKRGYAVRVENVATRAVDAAKQFRPDLVLLDIDMPEMDGGEVAKLLEIDQEIKTTIVYFTGMITQNEANRYSKQDLDYCAISKAQEPMAILSSVDKLLLAAA